MTLRGEHVPSLESETGPRAGQFDAIMGIDLAHAAISSLSGEPTGRQEPSQRRSHCQAEPTNRITPDTSFRIMYIVQGITSLRHSLHIAGQGGTHEEA